jgi:glyoxylase-like metal-dependent hydrolase (beta-lactamase superfamily II)
MPWKSVVTTFNVVEATLIAAHLEDAGIPTRTRQEAGGALGLTVGPFGQVDVLVPDSMTGRALAIIESLEETMTDADLFDSKYFRLYELDDGVYAAISRSEDGGGGGNAGFVDLGDDVLVFDAFLLPQAARDLLAAVDEMAGKPVRLLVNSHYHSDHIYGNGCFPTETLILSAPATREGIVENSAKEIEEDREDIPKFLTQLKKDLDSAPDDATRQATAARINLFTELLESIDEITIRPPDITFEGRVALHGSRRTAELIAFGVGHTDSDVILYLPGERIIFTGDLLFAKSHPYMLDSTPEVWRATLDALLNLKIKVVVPGHGEVSTTEDIRAERDYLGAVEELARQVIVDGGTADDAANTAIPEAYAQWDGARRFPDTMRFLFERLSARE